MPQSNSNTELAAPGSWWGRAAIESVDQHSVPKTTREVLEQLVCALGADTGAVFLVDADGISLRGAPGVWDWIRTSFCVRLDLWPTVRGALATKRVVVITSSVASQLERDWFEPSGIRSCICAPLVVNGRTRGVLFFDYFDRAPSYLQLGLAKETAELWGELLISDRDDPEASVEAASGIETPAHLRTLADLVSRDPVLIDPRVSVDVAERIALSTGARYLLAVQNGELLGIVGRPALANAPRRTAVRDVMRTEIPLLAKETSPEEAAIAMLESGVDCLPVLGADDCAAGVVTREALRAAGYLPSERGLDLCAACGSPHDLRSAGSGGIVFCDSCMSSPPANDTLQSVYGTLGGSG